MDDDFKQRIRRLSQQYAYTSLQMHESIGRKARLSGTDHKYLGFIMQKGQMTAGELSELTGLTSGSVTALIDRFEKKNLVKRKYSKDDRRKVYVVPETDKIKALLTPLYKDYRTKMDVLFATFSKKEIESIETYFSKAIKIMNETTDKMNNKSK